MPPRLFPKGCGPHHHGSYLANKISPESQMSESSKCRFDGREWNAIRPMSFELNYIESAAGSVLVKCGKTTVLCNASVEEKVPPFLENAGMGWLTAEYSMLPASTGTRTSRTKVATSGRTFEIQRLIGRSLRASLDRSLLGLRTITIDCDVLQADGGTRTASISGGYIALRLAIEKLLQSGKLEKNPITHQIAAISAGIVHGDLLLDLCYVEDSAADIDANLVATSHGDIVEIQATAEHDFLPYPRLQALTDLAMKGISDIIALQNAALAKYGIHDTL